MKTTLISGNAPGEAFVPPQAPIPSMVSRPKGLLWQGGPTMQRIDDTDVYKILMLYMIWSGYQNTLVRFAFKNRTTTIPLEPCVRVEEIQEHLDAYSNLRFSKEVVAPMRRWGLFDPRFLDWLVSLEQVQAEVTLRDGKLAIEAFGPWPMVTLLEIATMAIVTELAGKGYAHKHDISESNLYDEGNRRLTETIRMWNHYPDLRVADFGTRRRFSYLWHDHVVDRLKTELRPGIFTGTSNLMLSYKHDLEAIGTNAHELPMVLAALAQHFSDKAMRNSPFDVLRDWKDLFNYNALIMLDDTWGSDWFRSKVSPEILETYRGFRHDSGDPFAYGEVVIALYQRHGIDPRSKLIIFSDGLSPQLMIDLLQYFKGRINVAFGIGTNLTNNMGHIKAWSIVMKAIEAAGNPTVKLSNNLNKATGDPETVERYKRVFAYTNTFAEETLV